MLYPLSRFLFIHFNSPTNRGPDYSAVEAGKVSLPPEEVNECEPPHLSLSLNIRLLLDSAPPVLVPTATSSHGRSPNYYLVLSGER